MARKTEGGRNTRLADQIQKDLSEIFRLELKDRRHGLLTLTGVELSSDLTHAKVFYTVLGASETLEETAATLARARGFLRSQLAQRMRTRITPELHFVYDESVARGAHLSQLIDEVVREEKPRD